MVLEEFLNTYNCIMNQEEISEIKDINIKTIKRKYWNLKHKAFLDEQNISDSELEKAFDKYSLEEKMELEEYYNRKYK